MPATLLTFALLSTLALPDSSAVARDSARAPAVQVGPAAVDSARVPSTGIFRPDSSGLRIPPEMSDAERIRLSAKPRIVRTFSEVEVRALLSDPGASQVVHPISDEALHAFPVDNLADVIALLPGVVIQAEELHVRGGRSGETLTQLDGISLSEPLRRRPMDVPLLALSRAELVSGAPDARYGGGLAGVLDLRTVDPGERPSAEGRRQTDGGTTTHYDRVAGRARLPGAAFGPGPG